MFSRILTVPNLLTVFRMVLIPVFVTLLFYRRFSLALAVFILAGLTDGLDGLLARRFSQQSQLGTILDPIADKLMLVTAFIVLSMRSVFPQPLPGHLPVPFWVTVAVISRDVPSHSLCGGFYAGGALRAPLHILCLEAHE